VTDLELLAPAIDPACLALRRANFPDTIRFHAPGLKRYATSEYSAHDASEFVSISVTGSACALRCEHCAMKVLEPMDDLTRFQGSIYDMCAQLARRGARGVLVSGGCDAHGRVPLLEHVRVSRAREKSSASSSASIPACRTRRRAPAWPRSASTAR